jgi:hypothetical protein
MDKIIYLLVSTGGGVDGRDHTDKGGRILAATYDKAGFDKHPGRPWARIESRVVDMELARRYALAKLTPLDKLVLDLP